MQIYNQKKRKVSKSFVALVLTLVMLISVAGMGFYETWSMPDNITSSNYTTWQADTLAGALSRISTFLTNQISGGAPRQYRNNATYSEGSLQALKTAYDSAAQLPSNITLAGENLARLQLIRCVRSLEPRAIFGENEPSKILLNNYPDSKTTTTGKYTVEMNYLEDYPPPSATRFDLVFVLDWSNSMNHSFTNAPPLGAGIAQPILPNCARLIAKDIVLNVSKDLAEDFPGSRINILGVNTIPERTMDNIPGTVNFDEKTGFFSVVDYSSVIENVFSIEPTLSGDDTAQFTAAAIEELDARDDTSRTPVIVLLSDFQVYFYNSPTFINQSEQYWLNAMPAQADDFNSKYPEGALVAARFDHYGNRSFMNGINCSSAADTNMSTKFINRPHWNWTKITQSNFSRAHDLIKDMIYSSLPQSSSYDVKDPMGDKFNYSGNWTGTTNQPVYTSASDSISFQNEGSFTSQYQITADNSKFNGVKPETKYVTNKTTTLSYGNELTKTFHDLPTAFLPITQMAVELYLLEGTQAQKSDASNYSLEKVLTGENLAQYGGEGAYSDLVSLFAALPYGTELDRTLIWAIIQSGYPSLVNGYTRQDGDSLTKESIKVVFDAGKNVFKVYAFKEAQEPAYSFEKTAVVLPSSTPKAGSQSSPVQVKIGDTIQYQIKVADLHQQSQAVIVDTLPKGLTYISSSPNASSEQLSDGRVKLTWNLSLPAGESIITVNARVDEVGLFVNTADITINGKSTTSNETYHEAKQVNILHRFVELSNESNILRDEFSLAVAFESDYSLAAGIPPSVIVKDGKTYTYYGYRIDDGAEIIGAAAEPILQKVEQDHVITFLYRTTYTITLKYHDKQSPYTALAQDNTITQTIYSGDSFTPASANPPPELIHDRYSYLYTSEYKLQNDAAAAVPDTQVINNIHQDYTIIFTYQKDSPINPDNLILHIRQVVIDPSDRVPLPKNGYHNISGSSLANVNLISNSGTINETVLYTDYAFKYTAGSYPIQTIIPQFYSYVGGVVTTENVAHDPNNAVKPVSLDAAYDNEFWVTVYIQPSSESNEFTWDFKTNDFGVIAPLI